MSFATPEAAEDAYYDALEAGDVDALLSVWDDSDDVACALPMAPLATGREAVATAWTDALAVLRRIDLQVRHIAWIRAGDVAVHLVEELVSAAPSQPAPPLYATNIYRRRPDGWRIIVHQNAPVPPPPGTGGESFPHLP